MNAAIRNIALTAAASVVAVAVGGLAPAAACDIASPTDLSCGPANVNPGNPLSMNNPANPLSPLNISNPANPASPLNINNPANPASPLNPSNQWANSLQNPANPLSPLNPMNQPAYGNGYGEDPGYGSGSILGALFGLEPPQPASVVTPDDGYQPEAAPAVRHHHHHRHHEAVR